MPNCLICFRLADANCSALYEESDIESDFRRRGSPMAPDVPALPTEPPPIDEPIWPDANDLSLSAIGESIDVNPVAVPV